jgi:drug/metabolite transporter (DMT)-like permease
MMRPIYWMAILAAALGWGYGAIGTRAAYAQDVGAWTQIGIRIGIAAVLVWIVLLIKRGPLPTTTVVRYGIVQAGLNLIVPYVLFTFAYDEASAGFVGIFAATIPLATAIFANFMLKDEPLSAGKLLGLFVSLAGVAFLLLSGDSGLSEGGRPLLAAGLALTSVASIGYAGVHAKRVAGTYEPLTMTGLQFGFAAVLLVPAMFLFDGAPTDVSAAGWTLMLTMAIASTFMPFVLFFWLLQHITATQTSLIGYLVPLVALVGGILFLGEQLQIGIVAGGVLVFAGMIIADRHSRRATLTTRI